MDTPDKVSNDHIPTVSVVIPTYNRAEFLAQAIDSVLSQTCQDFEVIVVDDGSTDDTAQVVSAYGDRVRYVPIPHSGLPAVARNAGLQVARGEYIAFLDSDDQWLPDKLTGQLEALDPLHNVSLVCSNALVWDGETDVPLRTGLPEGRGHSGHVLARLLEANFIITSTVVVRRSYLNQVGPFCESRQLRVGEDYDLWLRLAAVSQLLYIPEPLIIAREHRDNLTRLQAPEDYWRGMVLIVERLQKQLPNPGQDMKELLDQRLYWCQGRLADALLSASQYRAVIATSLTMIRSKPWRRRGYWKLVRGLLAGTLKPGHG